MMTSINLLPWRIAEFRRKSRNMLVKIIIFGVILCASLIFTIVLQQQMQAEFGSQQANLSNLKQQLNETQQKVTALRHQVQETENLSVIATQDIEQFLALLFELPLAQGELNSVELKNGQLQIRGWVANQLEFEQLDRFLKQFVWLTTVKLEELSPFNQSELHFSYQLRFTDEKEK